MATGPMHLQRANGGQRHEPGGVADRSHDVMPGGEPHGGVSAPRFALPTDELRTLPLSVEPIIDDARTPTHRTAEGAQGDRVRPGHVMKNDGGVEGRPATRPTGHQGTRLPE